MSSYKKDYVQNSPHAIPPRRPKPKIGLYCPEIIASGRLNIKPLKSPLNYPAVGMIQKRLINEADIACPYSQMT